MAVVEKKGEAYPDVTKFAPVSQRHADPRIHMLTGNFAIANGDSIGSKLWLGKVPTDAVILAESTIHHTAVTGVTDLDVGLKYSVTDDPDILADGLTIAAAGTKSMTAAVSVANMSKRVWELLGLSSDPGGVADLYMTLNAAATAAGNVHAVCWYATRA